MPEPVPADPAGHLVDVARRLRAAGVAVGSGQVVAYRDAVAAMHPADVADLYWAGRATLITRVADLAAYDDVFGDVFGGVSDGAPPAGGPALRVVRDSLVDDAVPAGPDEGGERPGAVGAVASDVEVLRHRRFADLDEDERRAVRRLLAAIRLDPPTRRSRRLGPAPHGGRRPDLRRSLRRALRTDGEVVELAQRRRRTRSRRLVLLLDVSGSMTEYSRALLTFGHALSRGVTDVEVFCFGTRITRVTPALRSRDPDTALAVAADEVVDWDGGTRIGDAIERFLRRWGRPGMARGAVVVVCSDGLERGDPDHLGEQASRLSRLAHRLVWVNPLKGDPRYEPTARGMAAALPHLDDFLPGHDLGSLEDLAEVIAELS